MKAIAGTLVALALAGCGGATKEATPAPPQTQDGPTACADVLGEGKPVIASVVEDGCAQDNSIVTFVSIKCKDGSTFAASDDWQGKTGGTWTKGGAGNASDPAIYSAGVEACSG